jgi:hypothetical protein
LCLPTVLMAQNEWAFPKEIAWGRTFCKCFYYKRDSLVKDPHTMAHLGFDSVQFLVQEKYLKKTIAQMPIFDTITVKIPVDFTTRMANIPDEYTIIRELKVVNASSGKWILRKDAAKESLSVEPSTCLVWTKQAAMDDDVFIPTLTLKSTAHKLRVEWYDSIEIKQIVQRSTVVFKEEEIPAQYQTLLVPRTTNSIWSEWREVFICGRIGYTDPHSNPKLIEEIQLALRARGYYEGKINNKMTRQTKKALAKFKDDKGLPTGDFETFKALGL